LSDIWVSSRKAVVPVCEITSAPCLLNDEIASEPAPRILVIEDSACCRILIHDMLRVENLDVRAAKDGESSFSEAQATGPDPILLDLTLPGWDGYETLQRLKEDPATRSIPVVFLSASNVASNRANGLDLRAVDFVSKPVEQIELRARVRAALRTKYLQDLPEQRAHIDGLTGLGNRHALDDRLRSEWAACLRRGGRLSVVISDLDHFKKVNDTRGHRAGDDVLKAAARALRACVRESDFLARYGGEEFVVVAPDCDVSGAVTIAERFRSALETLESRFELVKIRVTASVGIAATTCAESFGPADFLGRADAALYFAKSIGRNVLCAWDPDKEGPVGAL
jgi:two-component system, cell cycle response regulator